MRTNDNTVSRQWATRPSDQRYTSIDDLYNAVSTRRKNSAVNDVALDMLCVVPLPDGEIGLADRRRAAEQTLAGITPQLTNWAFGQLCQRASAPAGYLRTLPAELACLPLQWSLEHRESEQGDEANDAKVLVRRNGHDFVSAITSSTYGRIWDVDVVSAVRDHVDLTRWKIPSASYSQTDPRRATTLYASDRDVFVFLVNEDTIEAAGEKLNRGFYAWNSETGAATFGIATFLYDRVCDNRIIWGQRDFRELKIRHTSGGPHRFIASVVPQLQTYAQSSASGLEQTISAAKAREVGKDRTEVLAWMKARGFTQPQAKTAYDRAEVDPRGYNPRSIWGLVQGATDAAHEISHTDDRTDLERRAGILLDVVAA